MTHATHFLNVDLDVLSRAPLDPLAEAFGKAVTVLYVGRGNTLFEAHFELARHHQDADIVIRRFIALIDRLPAAARKLWKSARTRNFNVGIQSALQPHAHELRLRTETLKAVARVGGSLVITTYAPVVEPSANMRQ